MRVRNSTAPRVTIITAVRNRAATLARTIESVLAQTYPEVEHVVIDGASSDGTVEVIRRYADRLAHWQSEPDRGISDAFNKGLAAARGDCIGLLNADDWLEPDQIERAVAALERSGADFVFGDLLYHDPAGRPLFRIRGDAALCPRDRPRHAGRQPSDAARPARGLRAGRRLRSGVALRDGLRLAAARPSGGLSRDLRAGGRRAHDARRRVRSRLPAGAGRGPRHRDRAWRAGRAGLAALSLPGRQGHRAAALRRAAPAGLYELLRRRVNPSYEPYRPGGRR